jgi:hypothetical protein
LSWISDCVTHKLKKRSVDLLRKILKLIEPKGKIRLKRPTVANTLAYFVLASVTTNKGLQH